MDSWDYNNPFCRECPARPMILDLTDEEACEPCRAVIRLQRNIESALANALALVENHKA